MTQERKGRRLNEEQTIKFIWKVLSESGATKKGESIDPFSDDVAWVINESSRKFFVTKADMMVSATDAPPQMTPREIARKSITAPVSDFAAKGVQPKYCIISLAIPRETATYDFIKSLAEGFAEASRKYRVKIIGGDTNSSASGIVIDCSVSGFSDSLVRRNGAKRGDLIGVSGNFGLQSSGLALLLGKAKSIDHSFRRGAEYSVLNPDARLSLGLRISKYLSSCIDSSDGLALSLYHLAESSDVDMLLDSIPIAEGVTRFASENSLHANDLALFGGEEYELVFTFDERHAHALSKKGIITIGRVVGKKESYPSVYYLGKRIARRGWIHNA